MLLVQCVVIVVDIDLMIVEGLVMVVQDLIEVIQVLLVFCCVLLVVFDGMCVYGYFGVVGIDCLVVVNQIVGGEQVIVGEVVQGFLVESVVEIIFGQVVGVDFVGWLVVGCFVGEVFDMVEGIGLSVWLGFLVGVELFVVCCQFGVVGGNLDDLVVVIVVVLMGDFCIG